VIYLSLSGSSGGISAPPPPQNRAYGSLRTRLKPFFSTMLWHWTTRRLISWLDDGRSTRAILDRMG